MGNINETEWDPEIIVEDPPLVWEADTTQSVQEQGYISEYKSSEGQGVKIAVIVFLWVVIIGIVLIHIRFKRRSK